MSLLNLGNSNFFYENSNTFYTKEYYNYIINLLKKILLNEVNLNINLNLNNLNCNFNNFNQIINLNVNYEHTLVKKGGRDTVNAFNGNINCIDNENEKYLVRIENFENLKNYDIIVDYSIPNILNIQSVETLDYYFKKLVYVAPYLYDFNEKNFNTQNRIISSLTTFINTNEPRRKYFLEQIKSINPNHVNVNTIFENNQLQDLYLKSKVLINIHQTDEHHTFEELRVLPALLSGVLIISEDSPLKTKIPYHQFIIWCPYNDIINKFKDVTENYEYYYNLIFKDIHKIKDIEAENYNNLKNKLMEKTDTLNQLSIKYSLDKNIFTKCHNYIPNYTSLFKNIKNDVKNVLEIGIGSIENGQMGGVIYLGYKTGNSLRCWRDYFKHAKIYGIDIYPVNITEDNIQTFQCDQSNTQQLENVIKQINNPLDIIIDDGSHNPEHQVVSFKFLEKTLSEKGIYVIEDIQPPYINSFLDLSIFGIDYISYIKSKYDIRFFDTRHILNRADDFMVAFIKK